METFIIIQIFKCSRLELFPEITVSSGRKANDTEKRFPYKHLYNILLSTALLVLLLALRFQLSYF